MTNQVNITRETSPARVNAILNHPSVRPWVASGDGLLDVSTQISDQRNVFLFGEHGGVGFLYVAPGVYEAHTQVVREGRGEWTRALTEACVRFMFTHTDAYEIVTRVPAGHIAAKAAAEAQGMRFEFTRERGVVFRGQAVDVHIYSFRLQDWVPRADGLVETGEWFHRRMEEEAKRVELDIPTHDDDPNHNRYVGSAVEMVFGGQVAKGIMWYNRWVTEARHMRGGKLQHVALVSENPVVIKIDVGLIRFQAGDIELVRAC